MLSTSLTLELKFWFWPVRVSAEASSGLRTGSWSWVGAATGGAAAASGGGETEPEGRTGTLPVSSGKGLAVDCGGACGWAEEDGGDDWDAGEDGDEGVWAQRAAHPRSNIAMARFWFMFRLVQLPRGDPQGAADPLRCG
jgi:hypothetical protein